MTSSAATISVRNGKATVTNQINLSNGQLIKSSQGILEGTALNLSNVVLNEQGGFKGTVNGTYNPNANNLAVENNSLTPDQISQINKSISLKGQSSLEGLPGLFDPTKKLSVADAASILQVAIDSGLKTNLTMNGGKAVALKDLKFADGKKPTGKGIVELQSASLIFGGKDLSFGDFLKFINASDIVFNSKITLTSEWAFTGSGLVTGNGNILDISQGGTIRINRNSQLYLSNLKLKGLGLGKIIFDDDTAKLLMSNVEIEMNRDYTFTQGGIYAEGPTVVMAKNYIWRMGLTSSMTVDGIAFMYDTSTFTDQKNIRPLPAADPNHKYLTFLNDGIIYRRSESLYQLNEGFVLDAYASTTLNVPLPISGVISLGTDSVLTLSGDMYWDSGATLDITSQCFIAGGGHTLHLGGDFRFPADKGIHFINSNMTIDGMGNVVTLGNKNTFLQVDYGSTLTLKNMILTGLEGNLQVQGGGTVVLQNVIANINQAHWSYDLGYWEMSVNDPSLVISGNVIMQGGGAFHWVSSSDLTINSNSILTFDKEVEFAYIPADSVRTHLVFKDQNNYTSWLFFNGSTLFAPPDSGGILFRGGKIFIDNNVTFFNSTVNTDPLFSIQLGDGVSYGNNSNLYLLSGATLKVKGYLYQNSL